MAGSLYKEVSISCKFDFFFVDSMNGQSSELSYLFSLNDYFPFEYMWQWLLPQHSI